MALIRPIRLPPTKPTRDKLHRLLRDYGITRPRCARLMRVHPQTLDTYLLPVTSRGHRPIPQVRWDNLLMLVQTIYHPDEPMEMQL